MLRRFPFIYWLPVLLYYAFITYLSGITPDLPDGGQKIPHLDKIFHFIEYTFFGLVLSRDLFWQKIFFARRGRWAGHFVICMSVLILLDEFHQNFTPNRNMNVWDGLTDAIGAAFGAVLFVFVIRGKKFLIDTQTALFELKERDKRRFAPFLFVIVFFVVMTMNILRIKVPIAEKSPIIADFFTFLEWAVLGFIAYRALSLCRGGKNLSTAHWGLLAALAAGTVLSYHWVLKIFGMQGVTMGFLIRAIIFYFCGVVISWLRIGCKRLKSRIEIEPAYQRTSWQRVYYFYPVMFGILLIGSFTILSEKIVPAGSKWNLREYAIMFTCFFTLGLITMRAFSWEAWWHEKSRQRVVWIFYCVFVFSVILFHATFEFYLGQFPILPNIVFNTIAVAASGGLYKIGLRITAKIAKPAKRPSC